MPLFGVYYSSVDAATEWRRANLHSQIDQRICTDARVLSYIQAILR